MLSRLLRPAGLASRALTRKFVPTHYSLTSTARPFASGIETAKKRLDKILSAELKHEADSQETDASIETFLSEKGWNLVESDDSNVLELKKNVEGNLVTCFFQARNPPMDEPAEENPEGIQKEPEAQEEDDAQQKQWDDYVDFTIVVNNNSGKYFPLSKKK
jgi:hypothetical protein